MNRGGLSLAGGRYSRITLVKDLDLSAIRLSRICVVGAGALGNEVLKNLVLYGPSKLAVVDNDRVEKSNLGRCFLFTSSDARAGRKKVDAAIESLGRMNEEVELEAIANDVRELDDSFFSVFNVVAGCVDNISSRLHINSNCYHRKVPYVDGGIDGLMGRVQVVIPPSGPCYQCSLNATHMAVLDRDFTCTGREANIHRRMVPSEPSVSAITASIESLEIVKLLSGMSDAGIMYIYNGKRNELDRIEVQIGTGCDVHGGVNSENNKT